MTPARLLRRLVLMDEGEAPALLWSTAYFFLLLFGFYLLRPVREAIGIARGADKLPWLMTGTLLAMALANPAFAALVSRLPRRRFIPRAYRFFALNMLAFFLAFRFLPQHGGAVLGLPAQDTLKRVTPEGKVHQTLERQDIWQIQTPQAFQAPLLWRAFTEAYSRNFYGTDEASLLEELQQPVAVIPGSPFNVKITTPDDLLLAEAILSMRRRKKHASRPGI